MAYFKAKTKAAMTQKADVKVGNLAVKRTCYILTAGVRSSSLGLSFQKMSQ